VKRIRRWILARCQQTNHKWVGRVSSWWCWKRQTKFHWLVPSKSTFYFPSLLVYHLNPVLRAANAFRLNLQGDVDQTMSDELRIVALGFDYKVLRYEMYDVNGYRFRTRGHEESRPGRRTTNSGVLTVCNGKEYYGILEEIYELKWNRGGGKHPKAVIFKCHWFDPEHYRWEPGVGLV